MPVESQVNIEYLYNLEVLENRVGPLPRATVRRPWEPDPRILLPLGTKDSDLITLYEHVATLRHRDSKQMFVAIRETMDCLTFQQYDPVKYPRWIMQLKEKRAELRIFFMHVRHGRHPSQFRHLGNTEWWSEWLEDVTTEWVHDTLRHYLLNCRVIEKEMLEKVG